MKDAIIGLGAMIAVVAVSFMILGFIGAESRSQCNQKVANLGYSNPVWVNGGLFGADHCYGTTPTGQQVILYSTSFNRNSKENK